MSIELTPHQQLFLNLYSTQHDQVLEQHARLVEQSGRLIPILNELRHNMQTIYTDARAAAAMRTPTADAIRRQTAPIPVLQSRNLVLPSPEYLLAAGTTTRIFSDIQGPLNTECPISLVPFEPMAEVVQINRCGHIFVRSELSQWLQMHSICPTCRTTVCPIVQQ